MAGRLELQTLLETILGSRNVYYQPPSSIQMKYPAIVYSRSDIKSVMADDMVYITENVYDITVIDKNPDSNVVAQIAKLSRCRYDRHFVSDNLNHDVFTIIY
jgi:hypothetical protein